jgi:hypothetical protein
MNARYVANRLTAWAEATLPRIAQLRYPGQLEANPADQARLLAEAMALELQCEEMQAYVHRYLTVKQLRGAVQHTLQAMQRELGRMPEVYQDHNDTDESTARTEGRAQAYRTALSALLGIIGALE